MNRLHVKLAITAAAGSLLFSNSVAAQVSPYSPKEILPPAKKAAHVQITQGPELESAKRQFGHHQVDKQQPWGRGRAFRSRALRYESQGT